MPNIPQIKPTSRFMSGLVITAVIVVACRASPAANPPSPSDSAARATVTHPPLDPSYAALIEERRDPQVPQLPFPDNPDPNQCGIPVEWGQEDPAWLTGYYDGRLIQPTVLLYDSHLRLSIAAEAPHGSEVRVLLFQQNPVIDYYFVKVKGAEPPNEGWVPAPFLSFQPLVDS